MFPINSTNWIPAAVIGLILLLAGIISGYLIARKGRLTAHTAQPGSRTMRERLRAIYNLTVTLIHTVNYEHVLDIALDMSLAAFAEDEAPQKQLASAALLFDDDRLVVKSARRFTTSDLRQTFPGNQGGLGKAIATGEPTLVTNPTGDAELGRVVALAGCAAVYLIPLRSGMDIYGVLLFGHPTRQFFNKDNREILDIIGSQSISAMENARLYNDLEREKERIVDAQEEARRKLARDLHDGPTQSIAAIAMRVNFARRLMEKDPGEAQDELYRIEDLARKTTREIRHMLFTLRPLVLESQGLKAALEAVAAKVNDTYAQNVIISVDENTVEVMDLNRLGVVFYIVEEAITNARKHARANHIWVRLNSYSTDVGLLEIEDDGDGFDVQSVNMHYDNRGSLGLYTLKEQAELINGVLQVESKPGQGTRIQVFIPFGENGVESLWQVQQ